ncbi:hypothetical protein TCDM_09978 [Trypanosoma cruzi Dm28c]|uniref:Mucin TcMUCII n=1 Tax=Trypanosoma cruzi Dm28c TaxID=1416333 RepID=V5ANQ2_TRYCR|nr:hypothetical protein TCDM_09978 [Trypanosoma cruzi Dm28c]
MKAHAGRAQPGVIIVCEGLPCGCHNGATVFLTGASRAGHHRSCQACQQARHAGSTNAGTRDGPGSSATASSQTPRAADPRRTTGDSASFTLVMPSSLGTALRLFVTAPARTTEYLPLLYGRPLCYSLVVVAAYNQNRITSCFVMNIGCTSRGPTIRVVCGDHYSFHCYFAFVLLCALHLLVCVCILREGCRHDGPLSRYVHAVEPCVPLLFASPSSICVLLLRQGCVCVCLLPWNGVCVLCAAYGACLAAALSSCGVPSVCVCCTSRLSCCSPFPSLCRSAPHY